MPYFRQSGGDALSSAQDVLDQTKNPVILDSQILFDTSTSPHTSYYRDNPATFFNCAQVNVPAREQDMTIVLASGINRRSTGKMISV